MMRETNEGNDMTDEQWNDLVTAKENYEDNPTCETTLALLEANEAAR